MNHARTDPLRQDARCDVNLAKLVTALGLRRIRFLAAPPTGSDCAELDAARGPVWECRGAMHFRPRRIRPYVRDAMTSDETAPLPRRSALVLRGPARQDWMHGIDRAANARQHATRVSATFRTLTA